MLSVAAARSSSDGVAMLCITSGFVDGVMFSHTSCVLRKRRERNIRNYWPTLTEFCSTLKISEYTSWVERDGQNLLSAVSFTDRQTYSSQYTIYNVVMKDKRETSQQFEHSATTQYTRISANRKKNPPRVTFNWWKSIDLITSRVQAVRSNNNYCSQLRYDSLTIYGLAESRRSTEHEHLRWSVTKIVIENRNFVF